MHDIGFVDRLSVVAYDQRSETVQDTTEVRANTTAACLSAPGSVTCRREAQFSFAQDEVGLTAIGRDRSRASATSLVFGAEWSRIRTEEMRDGRQTNLNTGVVEQRGRHRRLPHARLPELARGAPRRLRAGRGGAAVRLAHPRAALRPLRDGARRSTRSMRRRNPGRIPVGLTDSAWSPKLGALVPLGAGITLSLQAATGFRAPPYFDVNAGLSSLPLGYTVIPNPELESETSRGYEAGLRGRHGPLDWSVTAFRTDYDDLIVSRVPLPCPGDPRCVPTAPITFQSQNVSRARIEGIEASAELRSRAAGPRGSEPPPPAATTSARTKPLNSVDPAKVVRAWRGKGR